MELTHSSKTRFGRKTILVIDDEERLAQSLAALLRGVGYSVEPSTSGRKGIEKLKEKTYDLVITDLRMDDMDGFDVMRYITENCPETALIIITGHATTDSVIEALHQHVADYIRKPFDFDILRSSIEKVFAQQETERLKSDLIRMLTHDIKVPLTSIMGFAQMMVDEEGQIHERTAEFSETIFMNGQKILSLLENYLTNARVEAGKLEILPVPVNLPEVLAEVLHMLSPNFRRKGHQVEPVIDDECDGFFGDEPLIFRAVTNLLSNAVKYTPQGGLIGVRIGREEDEVVIEVSNTGKTLPPEEIPEIFDRYRRISSGKGIDGTGLGLHVVKCVAESHRGRVDCESEEGVTTFRLCMPFGLKPAGVGIEGESAGFSQTEE